MQRGFGHTKRVSEIFRWGQGEMMVTGLSVGAESEMEC